MRSNLIFLVLVLVDHYFIADENEYGDEGNNCRAVVRRVKTTHLIAAI